MPKMSRTQEARDLINEALMTCVMDEAARALLKRALREALAACSVDNHRVYRILDAALAPETEK